MNAEAEATHNRHADGENINFEAEATHTGHADGKKLSSEVEAIYNRSAKDCENTWKSSIMPKSVKYVAYLVLLWMPGLLLFRHLQNALISTVFQNSVGWLRKELTRLAMIFFRQHNLMTFYIKLVH